MSEQPLELAGEAVSFPTNQNVVGIYLKLHGNSAGGSPFGSRQGLTVRLTSHASSTERSYRGLFKDTIPE
jgi:hypothetical protein